MSHAFDIQQKIGSTNDHQLLKDGGVGTSRGDLWATYAGIRTLKWVGRLSHGPWRSAAVASLLQRQNPDGGFAWQRGLPSDVWASFYACQSLSDLGETPPNLARVTQWLVATQSTDGGFAMAPGQCPDVWATYYATRMLREILAAEAPDQSSLMSWLSDVQLENGGLTWAPGSRVADVRAVYYAVHAHKSIGSKSSPWDHAKLQTWLNGMQSPLGGFRFNEGSYECSWATFRATKAAKTLRIQIADREGCINWINERLTPSGFVRWEGYPTTDVWANFTCVGALHALGEPLSNETVTIVEKAISQMFLPDGGLTYRCCETASDALTTSAALISAMLSNDLPDDKQNSLAGWLQDAHMRWEGGVMYMPGRGAEIRCSLWAAVALKMKGCRFNEEDRLAGWIGELQNPDGGIGYWLGRGSDLTSVAASLALLDILSRPVENVLNQAKLHGYLASHIRDNQASMVPNGPPSCNATALTSRSFCRIGDTQAALRLIANFEDNALLGGYRDHPEGLPNLYSTYQVCLTRQVLGLEIPAKSLRRFLRKLIATNQSVTWTPMGGAGGDPLAEVLHGLLSLYSADQSFKLPDLVL